MLKELKQAKALSPLSKKERKSLKKVYRKQLVKRSHIYKIAAAWIITVPLSGVLGSLLFFTTRGMLP
jgi:PiT family inorganic phosphate transporter